MTDKDLLREACKLLEEWIFQFSPDANPDSTQFQYCRVCGKPEYIKHKDGCSGAQLIAELTERLLK